MSLCTLQQSVDSTMPAERTYTTSFFDATTGLEAHLSFLPWSSLGATRHTITQRALTEFAISGFREGVAAGGDIPNVRLIDLPASYSISTGFERSRDFLAMVASAAIGGSSAPTSYDTLDPSFRQFVDEMAHLEVYGAELSPPKFVSWAALHLASLGLGLSVPDEPILFDGLPSTELVYVCPSVESAGDDIGADGIQWPDVGLGIVAAIGGAMCVEIGKNAGNDKYSGMKRILNRHRNQEAIAQRRAEAQQRDLDELGKLEAKIDAQVAAGEVESAVGRDWKLAMREDTYRMHAGLPPRNRSHT